MRSDTTRSDTTTRDATARDNAADRYAMTGSTTMTRNDSAIPANQGTAPANRAASRLPLDDEALSRATLCRCADGPDALLQALVLGMGTADETLSCLAGLDVPTESDGARGGTSRWKAADSMTGIGSATNRSATVGPTTATGFVAATGNGLDRLEDAFAMGVRRWGGRLDARGMAAFRRALARWRAALENLPHADRDELVHVLTDGGRQWILAPHHDLWPRRLDDLSLKRDWATPLCLWGQGDPHALTACGSPVAIVGSRGCDDYGRRTASRLAERLADDGHVVVSGGAMGTDAAAHWGALHAADTASRADGVGVTVAVFAGGLDHAGPRTNMALFTRIIDSSGALVSELAPGTIPLARRFLLRNRIIAALAGTVVVAQARLRSGALNTAGWGVELGRAVYAVPGRIDTPNNAGCNRLIRDGAALLLDSADAVEELCGHGRHPTPTVAMTTVGTDSGDASGTSCGDHPDTGAGRGPGIKAGDDSDANSGHGPGSDDGDDRLDEAILSLMHHRSRRHGGITRDELMTRLRRRMGAAAPDMSGLLSALGRLELEGRLAARPAGYKGLTPTTGSGTDRPAASPAHRTTPSAASPADSPTVSQGWLPLP